MYQHGFNMKSKWYEHDQTCLYIMYLNDLTWQVAAFLPHVTPLFFFAMVGISVWHGRDSPTAVPRRIDSAVCAALTLRCGRWEVAVKGAPDQLFQSSFGQSLPRTAETGGSMSC